MNTPDEQIKVLVENSLRELCHIDKTLWERYNATGDSKFLTALSCSGDSRNSLAELRKIIEIQKDT